MERDEVLSRLTALDFMAVDMALYLDINPCDEEGIAIYNEILREANNARSIYEQHFGPLCSFRSTSDQDRFTWIDNTWPWQECANYHLRGDIC